MPGVEYRAGKTRHFWQIAGYSLPTSRISAALLICFVIMVLLVASRSQLSSFTLSALCKLSQKSSHSSTGEGKVPLFDFFANIAARDRRPTRFERMSTLVMVAGHAIYTGSQWTPQELRVESNWVLESFQKGQVDTFLRHIRKGVQLAANDSSALLLFSGGQTRLGSGPRSEGLTYWLAAEAYNWYGSPEVKNRSMSEEYARDSMENLLFSVCRFKQVTGNYPKRIRVVSFGFKKPRFVDVHRKALRFPEKQFDFIGIDPLYSKVSSFPTAAERENSLGPFSSDPSGCNNSLLRSKKINRNPYFRFFPYPQGCPELDGIFRHCGHDIYKGPLPWDASAEVKSQ